MTLPLSEVEPRPAKGPHAVRWVGGAALQEPARQDDQLRNGLVEIALATPDDLPVDVLVHPRDKVEEDVRLLEDATRLSRKAGRVPVLVGVDGACDKRKPLLEAVYSGLLGAVPQGVRRARIGCRFDDVHANEGRRSAYIVGLYRGRVQPDSIQGEEARRLSALKQALKETIPDIEAWFEEADRTAVHIGTALLKAYGVRGMADLHDTKASTE